MSLLMVRDLSLAYGGKVLFESESFSVGGNERVGLVGANGTGESTLMKILAGHVIPDEGQVVLRKDSRLGYLPQDLTLVSSRSLIESVLEQVPGRQVLDLRRSHLEKATEDAVLESEQMELAQELADVTEEWLQFDELFGRHRAEQILEGLGFRRSDFDKNVGQFSGGWKMRAALAGLLLQGPELLMLDEPTNHLDLPTLAWLDGFLQRSRKALILISHDRAFLNRHIQRVLSLELEGLRSYVGNYDSYRQLRSEEMEHLQNRADRLAARRAETEAFIERFRAKASKARQVQSRVKMLEKLEDVEVLQDRSKMLFSFPEAPRSGLEVANFKNVRRAFGTSVVYDNVNLSLLRGQRVAVVGSNGAGKTTLLKMLAHELKPDVGLIEHGPQVVCGYYAQHHADTLDGSATILDEVSRKATEFSPQQIRQLLGSFLFSGDDVDKPIRVLSGGEKARVALAKLLLTPSNLLLKDEPTNHLDLDSTEALISALQRYSGTLLFVSHNVSFLNQLATHVWVVENQGVTPFPGNLEDYWYHLKQKTASSSAVETAASPPRQDGGSIKERKRQEALARQKKSRIQMPILKEIQRLESAIGELEKLQKERETHLANPEIYEQFDEVRKLTELHRLDKANLEEMYIRWEKAQEQLSLIESD